MARRTVSNDKIEVKDDWITLRLDWRSKEDEGFLGYVTMIVSKLVGVKCSLYSKNGKDWISFPSYKDKEGEYQSQVFPMSKESAKKISGLVTELVDKILADK